MSSPLLSSQDLFDDERTQDIGAMVWGEPVTTANRDATQQRTLPDSFYTTTNDEEEEDVQQQQQHHRQQQPLMLNSLNDCVECLQHLTTNAHTTRQRDASSSTLEATRESTLPASTPVIWTHLLETYTSEQLTLVNNDDYDDTPPSSQQQAHATPPRLRFMAFDESTQEPKRFRWMAKRWKDAQGVSIYGRWFHAVIVEAWHSIRLMSADHHDNLAFHITGLISVPQACVQSQ